MELGGLNSYKQILYNSLETGIIEFYEEGCAIPKSRTQ